MTHDPKLVAAIDAAIKAAIRQHDLSDHDLYMMGEDGESEARTILTEAALDAIEAQGWTLMPPAADEKEDRR